MAAEANGLQTGRTGADLRLIPEYEPVRKLLLCFVHEFFNTRFHYGRVLSEVVKAAHDRVEIELFVGDDDLPFLKQEFAKHEIEANTVRLNADTPGRAILAEHLPVFARGTDGQDVALFFLNPLLDTAVELKQFSERLTRNLGLQPLDLDFDFATAWLTVNEDVVLLSEALFRGKDRDRKLEFFTRTFPSQTFHIVPPLAGDVTSDLDMYLWPIAPKIWIVSEYPAGTPQADSIEPALAVLRQHGHAIHRVPGLEPIIRDDINTLPNYANGVLVNGLALVPAYGRNDDLVVQGILENHGYDVCPIDCSEIILSNAALHCISKTVPA